MRVEGLGKQYRLGEQASSALLRDTLAGWIRRPWSKLKRGPEKKAFWALQDANFSVERGEIVGVIGHNGAGKSTLLKLISRITEPTVGRISIRGRIASLLEVGTGFHPDLTGRENIFMNGTILGMNRAEIRGKYDEIVEFAGVEKFINTPVRRYSSGMTVRLAFAVAAHLEPEILLLDEVLAVGDAEFQRKCLGKMNKVARYDGRTILFVSHSLSSIQQLCSRVIVLERGRIAFDGDTASGIDHYLNTAGTTVGQAAGRQIGEEMELESFSLSPNSVEVFGDIKFEMALRARKSCKVYELCLLLYTSLGQRVAIDDFRSLSETFTLAEGQVLRVEGILRHVPFVCGGYSAGFYVRADHIRDDFLGLQTFEVVPKKNSGNLLSYSAEHLGNVTLESEMSFKIT